MIRLIRKFSRNKNVKTTVFPLPRKQNKKEEEDEFKGEDLFEMKRINTIHALKEHRSLLSGAEEITVSDHHYKNIDITIAGSLLDSINSAYSYIGLIEEKNPKTIIIGMANQETLDSLKSCFNSSRFFQTTTS